MATKSSVSKKKTVPKAAKGDKRRTAKPEQIAPKAIDTYMNFDPVPTQPARKKNS